MACLIAGLEIPAAQGSFPGFACGSLSVASAAPARLSPLVGSEQPWAKQEAASVHLWVKASVSNGDAYGQRLASTSMNPPADKVFTGAKTF